MTDYVDRLTEETVRAVSSEIAPGTSCALLGYPNHTNPGDLAIWIAAKDLLARSGVEVAYECSWRDYAPNVLAGAVAGGAQIVFTGGGNFGDVWPATHALRERVLAAFPGVRVLQLPQTVHFLEADALARTRTLLERHGNTVLMVRDETSRALAADAFDVELRLAPDLGLACPLGPAEDRACAASSPAGDGACAASGPVSDIVVIAREDRESRGLACAPLEPGVWRIDWNVRENERRSLEGEPPLSEAVLELIEHNRNLTKRVAGGEGSWQELARVRDALARARLDRGCHILRRGRVIVTDSLHAHLLGLRLGIPTVVTDTRYGKVRATFETFTRRSPCAHWADTPTEALARAHEICVRRSGR